MNWGFQTSTSYSRKWISIVDILSPATLGHFSIYTQNGDSVYCILSPRLCKHCWLCIEHSIENILYMSLYVCRVFVTYRSAVAQSFVSVAEADTSRYGPWHCQHEAPPSLPPQKLWLLKGSIHHWTSVLWFDTIVQIFPFCPLSPRFLASDLALFFQVFFFFSPSLRWMNPFRGSTCATCKSFLMVCQI